MMFKKLCLVIFIVFLFYESLFSDDFFSAGIPMRDDKYLSADVYSPDTTQAFPVILIKTPYNKGWYQTHGLPLNTEDYAFVIVDWRGFYGSAGAATDSTNHGEDGYDCVEWIAEQNWCNGKIGMWGISAVGVIQYKTAREHPPHLVCGVPIVCDYMQYYQRYFCGGVYRKEYVETLDMLGYGVELILEHPLYDVFWAYVELITNYPQKIDIPMLLIGGWYDHHSYIYGIFRIFNDLRTQGGIGGREHHKFIIGPWHHHAVGDTIQGELEYPNPAGAPESEALDFFDYWLRDIPNNYDTLSPVRYYQMGTDNWLSDTIWLPDNVNSTLFYLHPAGSLSVVMPVDAFPPDSFYYDPRDPSPTIGGATISYFLLHGPYDQRWEVENRDDALLFSTGVLDKELVVNGEVKVQLYVSSDCLDTDFSVRLCDVYPDGRSMLVMEGIQRMRFRESFEEEILMTPGEIYQVTIKLPNTALTFLQGHRVRICISSSNYPRFDINLNNGDTLYTPGDTLIALNRIYHDVNYPSALILPVKKSSGVEEITNRSDILSQNAKLEAFPNPFTQKTVIRVRGSCSDQHELPARITIYDLCGRLVKSFPITRSPNNPITRVVWNGKNSLGKRVGSGIYFYKLKVGDKFSQTKKLLLFR